MLKFLAAAAFIAMSAAGVEAQTSPYSPPPAGSMVVATCGAQAFPLLNNGKPVYAATTILPSGLLCTNAVGGASGGSVTAAGTNGTQAQAVQGINGGVPIAVTGAATNPVSYALLTNASTTGPAVAVTGGNYLLGLNGTFGGATVAIASTANGVTTTIASYTSAPSTAPCFAVATGTTVQATVTGGTPSGLNATLGGIGAAGCAAGLSGTFTQAGTTGTDYSANAPAAPVVGANFGTTGLYANYVLIKTIPAGSRNYLDVENTSGAQIVLVIDDGTATNGSAPANASIIPLSGGGTAGAQGGSLPNPYEKGRVQVYAPLSTAFVAARVN